MKVYVYDGNQEIPEDETCYIIAKGGIYLKKKLDLIESLTPVDKVSFLEEIPTFAKINIPMIPTKMLANIVAFFKEVYRLYKSEAIVLLFFNKDKNTYTVFVPEQEVSGASLSYTPDKTIKDHILIGTIHSHANMAAFHSGTDVGDEAKFDGIHMTIGKVGNDEFFDICASIAVNGLRIPVVPEEYVMGLESREYTPYFKNMFRPSFVLDESNNKLYQNTVKSSFGYVLNCKPEDFKFKKEWIDKVKERTYQYNFQGKGNVRYVFENGKLIKIGGDVKDDKSKVSNLFNTYGSSILPTVQKTDNCEICSKCVHRFSKLKMEEIDKINEKDCVNNFERSIFDVEEDEFEYPWGLF